MPKSKYQFTNQLSTSNCLLSHFTTNYLLKKSLGENHTFFWKNVLLTGIPPLLYLYFEKLNFSTDKNLHFLTFSDMKNLAVFMGINIFVTPVVAVIGSRLFESKQPQTLSQIEVSYVILKGKENQKIPGIRLSIAF